MARQPKVLFIMPKISVGSFDLGIPNEPPLGIASLMAYLREHGVDRHCIDLRLGIKDREVLETIKSYQPDLIGVTCWSLERNKTYELINRVQKMTDIPIVMGGPHVSAIRTKCMEEISVPYAVKSEGEATLVELLEYVCGRREDLRSIDGLIYREDGKIVENCDRAFIEDLDSLPMPAYDEFDLSRYTRNRLHVISSRGCPYRCNFCSVKLQMGQRFRPRSPENFVDELEHWYNMGFTELEFADDVFNFNIPRAEQICDLIMERGLRINWHVNNGIRAERVTEQLIRKMVDAGCKTIVYGVEAGDDQLMKNMKKGLTVDLVERAIAVTHRVGVNMLGVTFIVGHPGETLAIYKNYLKRIKSWRVDKIKFYNLVPYPGTDLYDWVQAEASMLEDEDTYLQENSYYSGVPFFETEQFSAADRAKALEMGLALEYNVARKYFQRQFTEQYGPLVGFVASRLVTKKRTINFLARMGVNDFVKRFFTRHAEAV